MEMDERKTGDLFSCSLEFGAIIANASASIEEHIHQAGLHLGLAYQIRDDLEDISQEETKPTLTNLLGREATQKILKEVSEKILHHLSFIPSGASTILSLINPYLTGSVKV